MTSNLYIYLCFWVELVLAGERDILVYIPLSKSRLLQAEHITSVLRTRGYNITYALPQGLDKRYVRKLQQKNYAIVQYKFSEVEAFRKPVTDIQDKVFSGTYDLSMLFMVSEQVKKVCKAGLENTTFIKTLNESKFKLAIVDGNPYSSCALLIPYALSIPKILISDWIFELELGIPSFPSVTPFVLQPFQQHMTFSQRLWNSVLVLGLQSWVSSFRSDTDLLQHYLPFTTWAQLYGTADFVLIPRDHHLGYPSITMPHALQLPGISYSPPEPIPQDLQDFIKNKQLIIFSFGNYHSELPYNITTRFLDAFQKLPNYAIIWRYTGELESDRIPPNVLVSPWIPQNDLLGDPNAALFMTHCGNNGQYESAYHGVPMLGFPLDTEQHYNAKRMTYHGIGKEMNILTFTDKELKKNILDILSDNEINKKAKKLAAILKSYPLPAERAADAVEHVMRFGSGHLKGVTATMPLYKLFMLDIFLFVLLTVLCCGLVIFFCGRLLISKIFSKKKKTD